MNRYFFICIFFALVSCSESNKSDDRLCFIGEEENIRLDLNVPLLTDMHFIKRPGYLVSVSDSLIGLSQESFFSPTDSLNSSTDYNYRIFVTTAHYDQNDLTFFRGYGNYLINDSLVFIKKGKLIEYVMYKKESELRLLKVYMEESGKDESTRDISFTYRIIKDEGYGFDIRGQFFLKQNFDKRLVKSYFTNSLILNRDISLKEGNLLNCLSVY